MYAHESQFGPIASKGLLSHVCSWSTQHDFLIDLIQCAGFKIECMMLCESRLHECTPNITKYNTFNYNMHDFENWIHAWVILHQEYMHKNYCHESCDELVKTWNHMLHYNIKTKHNVHNNKNIN